MRYPLNVTYNGRFAAVADGREKKVSTSSVRNPRRETDRNAPTSTMTSKRVPEAMTITVEARHSDWLVCYLPNVADQSSKCGKPYIRASAACLAAWRWATGTMKGAGETRRYHGGTRSYCSQASEPSAHRILVTFLQFVDIVFCRLRIVPG